MTSKDQLVEQHVKAYNSKLKHIDELADKAGETELSEHQQELAALRAERDKLARCLAEMDHTAPETIVEAAGPMAVWDLVAQRLEELVEKIQK